MIDSNDNKIIDRIIRLGLLALLLWISMRILAPFMIMLIWAIIIAVALFPLFKKTTKLLGGRKTLAAVLFAFVGLSVIVVPSILLTGSSAQQYQNLSNDFDQGKLHIPTPTEDVKDWPLVGEQVYSAWDLASHNLRKFIQNYRDEVRNVGSWLLDTLADLGITILLFVVSLIIAVVLLAKADLGHETTNKFATRLVGEERGKDFVKLIAGTIRSVVQGVLGIALIQAIASAILFLLFNIPIAGLWALIILILAIMQLPPLLVLGPIIIYVFTKMDTVPAVIFTVFAVLISISDSLLKPIFLGRGVDVPMLVVLLGAIGGMLVFGILGLFVGAVVLALSYKLMIAWLKELN